MAGASDIDDGRDCVDDTSGYRHDQPLTKRNNKDYSSLVPLDQSNQNDSTSTSITALPFIFATISISVAVSISPRQVACLFRQPLQYSIDRWFRLLLLAFSSARHCRSYSIRLPAYTQARCRTMTEKNALSALVNKTRLSVLIANALTTAAGNVERLTRTSTVPSANRSKGSRSDPARPYVELSTSQSILSNPNLSG